MSISDDVENLEDELSDANEEIENLKDTISNLEDDLLNKREEAEYYKEKFASSKYCSKCHAILDLKK